jgi:hypothetical protein
MLRRTFIWVLIAAALLLPASAVMAKGRADMISIVGPGLDGKLNIQDAEIVHNLSIGQFEDFGSPVEAPDDAGPAYEMTRYFKDEGNYVAFDRVRYHPGASGSPGYVYYIGIDNGWTGYDGKWFLVTDEGEQTMQAVLAQNSVELGQIGPSLLADTGSIWVAVGMIGLGALLGVAGSRLRLGQRRA